MTIRTALTAAHRRTDRPVRLHRRAAALGLGAVLMMLPVALAGCGAPDRSAEADLLQKTLTGVPGVESALVTYSNGFDSGYTVAVDVQMPTATDQQIVSMVRGMNSVMADDFEDFSTPVSISLGDGVSVQSIGQMDPDTVARDLTLARLLRRGPADAGTVKVSRVTAGLQVRIQGVADTARAVTEATAAVGETPASVDVFPRPHSDQAMWTVDTPVSQTRLTQLTAAVGRLSPAVQQIDVENNVATEAIVGLDTTVRAPILIDSVISALGAGRSHPLRLEWRLEPLESHDHTVAGTVTVGTCDYPKARRDDSDPESDVEVAAAELQKQMRAQYDTCPR